MLVFFRDITNRNKTIQRDLSFNQNLSCHESTQNNELVEKVQWVSFLLFSLSFFCPSKLSRELQHEVCLLDSVLALLALLPEAPLVAGYSTNCKPSSASATTDRRGWMHGVASAATAAIVGGSTLPLAAFAELSTSKLTLFEDAKNGFAMKVPQDWIQSERTLPDRRTIRFWADPADTQTFVFVAYTPVRDDFTSLGSFGSVESVADQTILPKGELAGVENIESKMVAAVSERQAYFFDYQQRVPNVQPMTHFRTIFTLQPGATGGAGSILVTITAQTPEERYAFLKPMFDDMMESFNKIKMT